MEINKNRVIKKLLVLLTAILSLLFFIATSLYSDSLKERPHGDKNKLPKGCGSCHMGHGAYNTPMLTARKDSFCFRCHGQNFEIEKSKHEGALAQSADPADIQTEFEKPYRHPIGKTGIHRFGETLPETDSSLPRHAECGDCHHHHFTSGNNKMSGVKGTDKDGAPVRSVKFEYELCFNCHSRSANLPTDQVNKAELFNISNPSFHPVIGPGRNSDVPSLTPPLSSSSTIKCTDCHNNDNPRGPKGPHGSIYKYLLSRNFTDFDGPEGSYQYDLCYGCHRRNSILGNESFLYHELHISRLGTSCRTCHNPHGSTMNAHLIQLDSMAVRPSSSGQLGFIDFGPRAGQCFLNCHDKDHDPAAYPGPSTTSPASPQLLKQRYRR